MGNEVNLWYEKYGAAVGDPNGFQHFVTLYHEIYDAVKELSPQTRVFSVFAREMVAEQRQANLEVLRMFKPEKLDLLVFTSYPHAVQGINRPADIPDDYYARAFEYLPGKTLGFSELGWPSQAAFGSEQGQADFLNQAVGRLTQAQGINLHLVAWSRLSDLGDGDYVGLIRQDGTEKNSLSGLESDEQERAASSRTEGRD